MKGILIFLIVAVMLIAVGIGVYFFAFSESEEDLRKGIEDGLYEEQIIEMCSSRAYAGFKSKVECENAVRCISMEMAERIKQEDLKEMSNKIEWSNDKEHTITVYLTNDFTDYKEIDSLTKYCLEQNGYNATNQ